MPTPETLLTDTGKDFLSKTFEELSQELEEQCATTFIFFRADEGEAGMFTRNPRMIEALKNYIAQGTDLAEEARNAGE